MILLVLHHNSVDREVIVSFIGGASSIRLSETSGLRHDVGVEPRYVGVEPRYVAEVMVDLSDDCSG